LNKNGRAKTIQSNLSTEEDSAIKSLSNDETIVIKEADKGGAVVVMDSNYYRTKIMQILTNADFYAEINENQDKKVLQKIKKLLNKYPSSLTDKEEDFVTNFDLRESCFYGLPKIHKSATIKEAIKTQNSDYITCKNPEDLTLRPIVGGPSAPTQRLSNLLDIELKPLCCEVKSYVRDDLDFYDIYPAM
jgi:hypothetical protein